MNCECIFDVERGITDHFRAEAGHDVRATCNQVGINLSSGSMTLSIGFTVRGNSRRFSTSKGVSASMVASFCPFCGKCTGRYVIGEDAGIAAAMGGAA